MQIDPIRLEEVSALQELATQTFAETFAHDNDPKKLEAFFEEAYSLEVLTSELSDSNCQHYFLRVDHQIAGYLKLNQGPAQTEHELENAFEIQRIYLLKAYQGQGLGKKLFEFALEKAEQRLNESTTGEMGLINTIHDVHAIIVSTLALAKGE